MMAKDLPDQLGDTKKGLGAVIFLATADLEGITSFYTETIGMEIWHTAPQVTVLRFGNLLLGMHDQGQGRVEAELLIAFTYPDRAGVDAMYPIMQDTADAPPRVPEQYQVYSFFASDPEGRKLEFQHLLPDNIG
jgi:catechol-2,3-dioxygenase